MAAPGFYIAHHRWLDGEFGPGKLYKVGHTGDLRRRLTDDSYVTCFPSGWRFVYTIETSTKLEAHRLESGVLACANTRRVGRDNGIQSELVHITASDLITLANKVCHRLGIDGVPRESPEYERTSGTTRSKGAPSTNSNETVLTRADTDLLLDLAVPVVPVVPVTAPVLPRKTVEEYINEARAALRLTTGSASTDVSDSTNASDSTLSDDIDEDDTFIDMGDVMQAVAINDTLSGSDTVNVNTVNTLRYPIAHTIEEREYQADAIQACMYELDRAGRAILQMACRCGKTLVAHRIIQAYVRRIKPRPRVLYLVPGLALMRQTVQKLNAYSEPDSDVEVLLVGSDDKPVLGINRLHNAMATDINTMPAGTNTMPTGTTNPDTIDTVCRRDGRPLLVVSTYQSSPLLPDVFDLTVFDESHRVCGDRKKRPFNHVLLEHRGGHRLYMTATPRYDAPLSMKERDLFGGVAYAYRMRQGIDAGYVNPFSLELVGREVAGTETANAETNDAETTSAKTNDAKTTSAKTNDAKTTSAKTNDAKTVVGKPNKSSKPANIATAPQIIAAARSVTKLLVFCRSIRHATELCREVSMLLTDVSDGASVTSSGAHECLVAHSRMPRADIVGNLTRFCSPEKPAILFNCRLFQEGVEIPPLDGIFFASPRHSPRDIVQSLCRPLNVMQGKPASKVFIPVAIDPGSSPDDVKNLERFASIIPYFDALVSEDPLLYEHLLDPQGAPYPLHWVNSSVKGVGGATLQYNPDALLSAARRSIRRGGNGKTERLLRAAKIPWEIGFAELDRIVTECGRYPKTTDCFVYGDAKVNFGQFYRYARDAYAKWVAGQPQPLEPHQLYALESLPGWKPFGIEGPYPWKDTLAFLEQWLEDNDGVPPMVEINKGGYVGLEATWMERLSGTLTCINQSDGRDRKGRSGTSRPGSGFTLDASKQRDLDELCARWDLRWRKERRAPPEGGSETAISSTTVGRTAVGSLVENDKGEYVGEKTFIQEAYSRFKAEWKAHGTESEYIQKWFPQYPRKHAHQERLDVWGRRKEIVPPRWRGRGKVASGGKFDAAATIYR